MTKLEDVPGWQAVPAAMGMTADHAPEAQRWKLEPPMQFHSPSEVQAPERPPVAPPAGGALDGTGAGAPLDEAGGAGAMLVGATETTDEAAADVCVCRVVGVAVVGAGVGSGTAD